MATATNNEALAEKLYAIYHDHAAKLPKVRTDENPDWEHLEDNHKAMWNDIADTAASEGEKTREQREKEKQSNQQKREYPLGPPPESRSTTSHSKEKEK